MIATSKKVPFKMTEKLGDSIKGYKIESGFPSLADADDTRRAINILEERLVKAEESNKEAWKMIAELNEKIVPKSEPKPETPSMEDGWNHVRDNLLNDAHKPKPEEPKGEKLAEKMFYAFCPEYNSNFENAMYAKDWDKAAEAALEAVCRAIDEAPYFPNNHTYYLSEEDQEIIKQYLKTILKERLL